MDVRSRCCPGLDVHAKTVVAHLIKDGQKQTCTFSTMKVDLEFSRHSDDNVRHHCSIIRNITRGSSLRSASSSRTYCLRQA